MLNKKQKKEISKYLFDVSKLTFAAVVVGRFVSHQQIHRWVFIGGLILCIVAFVVSVVLLKDVNHD